MEVDKKILLQKNRSFSPYYVDLPALLSLGRHVRSAFSSEYERVRRNGQPRAVVMAALHENYFSSYSSSLCSKLIFLCLFHTLNTDNLCLFVSAFVSRSPSISLVWRKVDRPNDEYESTGDYKGSYGGGGSSYGGGGGGGGGAYPGEYRSMGSPQPRQPTASDYKSPGEYRSMGSPQPMQSTMFASGMQQGINNSGSYMNGVVPAFQNINISPGQQQVVSC